MKHSILNWLRRARAIPAAAVSLFLTGSLVRADVVFAWNEAMLQLSSTGAVPPHLEARVYAMGHLAMEEAIATVALNPGDRDGNLAAQRAAAVAAAHDVLVALLPRAKNALDALALRHFGALPEGSAKERGISTGTSVAAQILQRRQTDGWSELAWFPPVPESSPAAAAALAQGEKPMPSPWLKARPFALKSAGHYVVMEVRVANIDGGFDLNFALLRSKLFDEVDRAAAVDSRARHWAVSPLMAWNRIARQATADRALDLAAQARLLATLNVALADATLSALHWRHTVGTWRVFTVNDWRRDDPQTPRSLDLAARPGDGTQPYVPPAEPNRVLIPPMPNHPSVAATIAGAAQAVLAAYFKSDHVSFALPCSAMSVAGDQAVSDAPRAFTRISAAAKEYAFLASLEGTHPREACIAGYALGSSIGGYIGKRSASGRGR